MSIPILVLKIYTKKVHQSLTKLKISGRDISKTVSNITKNFSMILIYIKMISSTKFHFCGNVPLNDPCEF